VTRPETEKLAEENYYDDRRKYGYEVVGRMERWMVRIFFKFNV
jgi:hypothetical protein